MLTAGLTFLRLIDRVTQRAIGSGAQTATAIEQQMYGGVPRWCRVGCWGLALGAPVAKAVQFAWFGSADSLRQGIVIGVAGVLVLATVRPAFPALVGWHLTGGGTSRRGAVERRWLWPAVGLASPLLCALSVCAHLAGSRGATIALTASSAVPLAVLGVQWRRRSERAPLSATLWTVAPATLLWMAIVLGSAVFRGPFGGPLGDFRLWPFSGDAGDALGTAVVIGFGEEYLFRGLLLVLAIRCGVADYGFLIVGLSFGLWHVPDAWDLGFFWTLGTFVMMVLASQLVFVPLRLRSGTLAAPALFHAAHNLALRLV